MSEDYKPILEGVLKQEDLKGREPLEIVKDELLKNGYPVSDIKPALLYLKSYVTSPPIFRKRFLPD